MDLGSTGGVQAATSMASKAMTDTMGAQLISKTLDKLNTGSSAAGGGYPQQVEVGLQQLPPPVAILAYPSRTCLRTWSGFVSVLLGSVMRVVVGWRMRGRHGQQEDARGGG